MWPPPDIIPALNIIEGSKFCGRPDPLLKSMFCCSWDMIKLAFEVVIEGLSGLQFR